QSFMERNPVKNLVVRVYGFSLVQKRLVVHDMLVVNEVVVIQKHRGVEVHDPDGIPRISTVIQRHYTIASQVLEETKRVSFMVPESRLASHFYILGTVDLVLF